MKKILSILIVVLLAVIALLSFRIFRKKPTGFAAVPVVGAMIAAIKRALGYNVATGTSGAPVAGYTFAPWYQTAGGLFLEYRMAPGRDNYEAHKEAGEIFASDGVYDADGAEIIPFGAPVLIFNTQTLGLEKLSKVVGAVIPQGL